MLENIMKICAIFDPVFIITIGSAMIILLLLKMFHSLNEGNKDTKHIPLGNYIKSTGKIINYEYESEQKIIEKDGKKEQITIQKKYPIVEYALNNEMKTYKYPKAFYKEMPDNIGYQFAVYLKNNNENPVIKYDDIYYIESRKAEKTTYIVCGIIAFLFAIATIFSIIGH